MPAGSIEGPPAGYSLQDVAAALGVSVNTLRKQIRAGQVRAERVEHTRATFRGKGIPRRPPSLQATSQMTLPSRRLLDRLQQPAKEMMQAEAMAAYMWSLLET